MSRLGYPGLEAGRGRARAIRAALRREGGMFKVNEYFDGRVKSLSFRGADGPATVGVMAPGEYEFGTSSVEVMTVTSGSLAVRLPGSTDWTTIERGGSFTVQANVKFGVRAPEETSYLCLYR
jgi:hypothetical protein